MCVTKKRKKAKCQLRREGFSSCYGSPSLSFSGDSEFPSEGGQAGACANSFSLFLLLLLFARTAKEKGSRQRKGQQGQVNSDLGQTFIVRFSIPNCVVKLHI